VVEAEVERLIRQGREIGRSEGISLPRALHRVHGLTRDLVMGQTGVEARVPHAGRSEEPPRFVCDGSLGGLTRWLWAAGYEARAAVGAPAAELIEPALETGAVLLTSDSRFMERNLVRQGKLPTVWVSSALTLLEQLEGLLLDLCLPLKESRCMACGGQLAPVPKTAVQDRIPEKTARWKDEYFVCRECDQLFWEGTHWQRIRTRLTGFATEPESESGRRGSQPAREESGSGQRQAPDPPLSAVDTESLEMMRSVGGDELLFELIDLTLEDTPPRLAEMRQAFDRGDLEKVGFVAHTLKGWSGQLGAKRMAELCRRLEVLKRGAAVENTPGLVRDLEREWEEVRAELLAVRSGGAAH